MEDIFCKIIKKELGGNETVAEGDDWVALRDINPKAPVHILIIPKRHIAGLEDATEEDANLLGKLIFAAKEIAKQLNLKNGFRIVINQGRDGGQVVPHLHIHLLGGKKLGTKVEII